MAEEHDTVRGLVLAGGGAKGSYQVGVYQALMELGWLPDVITGASVGSLNAALFVMGKVNEAADLWRSLDNHGVLELPEGKTPEELRNFLLETLRGGGLNTEPLGQTIDQYMDENAIRASHIKYGLVITEMNTLRSVQCTLDDIPQGQLKDYMLASSACFPALRPYEIDGVKYIDGGWRDNMPLELAAKMGATELIGVDVVKFLLPEDVTKEALIDQIEAINADDSIHGCLLFRPLPKHLKADQNEICNRLDPRKDVDCMTDLSNAGVFEGRSDLGFAPCTPQACMEILDYYGIDCKGKNAVVIGRSLVVGKPAAMMLMAKNATVTVCHTKTVDVAGIARKADILVSAAGVLNSLTKDYVSEGQIVIDVSINWDPEKINAKGGKGAIAGDAVYAEVEPIVGAITPVPGGVGSVTTCVLCKHVVQAAEMMM